MPIRLNLLAEAQAAEELRRQDPVKKVLWIAALLVALVLVWASSLQLRAIIAKNDLGHITAKINLCTNDYQVVSDMQKQLAGMAQKLTALHKLTTNRFLNGTLLDALQHTTVEDVQLTHLKLEQSFLLSEGTAAKTNGNRVIPGSPAKVIEKTVLTLDGSDSSHNPGDQVTRVKDAMDKYPYFRDQLGVNGVSWKNSSSPQVSPETGRAAVLFTFECRYPEITR